MKSKLQAQEQELVAARAEIQLQVQEKELVAARAKINLQVQKVQEKELAAARAEIERLTKRLQELELSNGGNYSQSLLVGQKQGPKCSNGHLMKQTRQVITRVNRAGEIIWSGHSLFCNMCGDDLDPLKGYYHCGNNLCDYDFCLSCGISN